MQPNDLIFDTGYITQAKYLRMQPPRELENRIGYRKGRLAEGWWLLFLEQQLGPNDFEFRGYTQMSGGVSQGHLKNPPDPRNSEARLRDGGYDLALLKRTVVRDVFEYSGPNRLARVLPIAPEFGKNDYPKGTGIPQWVVTCPKGAKFRVVGKIEAGKTYTGNYL